MSFDTAKFINSQLTKISHRTPDLWADLTATNCWTESIDDPLLEYETIQIRLQEHKNQNCLFIKTKLS